MTTDAAHNSAPSEAGRHRLYDEPMKPRSIRMTDAQAEKLDQLGGGQWVRDQIDDAAKTLNMETPK